MGRIPQLSSPGTSACILIEKATKCCSLALNRAREEVLSKGYNSSLPAFNSMALQQKSFFAQWCRYGMECQANPQEKVRGVIKGAQFPGRRIAMGTPKSPNNVTNTFFNTVYLLPKDLRFEHGGAKLASWPGRHLTSLRPGKSFNPSHFKLLHINLFASVKYCSCNLSFEPPPRWNAPRMSTIRFQYNSKRILLASVHAVEKADAHFSVSETFFNIHIARILPDVLELIAI